MSIDIPPETVIECINPPDDGLSHPETWPVDELRLGAEIYDQAMLLDLLRTCPDSDASLILGHVMIEAKILLSNGIANTTIATTIDQADHWLAGFDGRLPYRIPPTSSTGQQALVLAHNLASYIRNPLDNGLGDQTIWKYRVWLPLIDHSRIDR